MSDVKAALVEIRRMTKQFKAFEQAEQALTVLAGYEQNVAEIQARLVALNEEGEKQAAINADLAAWADKVKAGAKQDVADARTKADNIAAEAEVKLAQRREEADVNLNNTAIALAALEEQYADLDKQKAVKEKELADLEARISGAREALAKFTQL